MLLSSQKREKKNCTHKKKFITIITQISYVTILLLYLLHLLYLTKVGVLQKKYFCFLEKTFPSTRVWWFVKNELRELRKAGTNNR